MKTKEIRKRKGGVSQTMIVESISIFLAIFIVLFMSGKFVPSNTAQASDSEKSLLGLEQNIIRFEREDTFPFTYPLFIGKDIYLVAFSKGTSEVDSLKRPQECNSAVIYSCICLCKGDCESVLECTVFEEFDTIELSPQPIKGQGIIEQVRIEKPKDKSLKLAVITTTS